MTTTCRAWLLPCTSCGTHPRERRRWWQAPPPPPGSSPVSTLFHHLANFPLGEGMMPVVAMGAAEGVEGATL